MDATFFNKEFGHRLKSQRKKMGFKTQAKLAQAIGIERKETISDWERGAALPDIQRFVRLCELLECSADWLLFGKEPIIDEALAKFGLRREEGAS